MLVLRVLPDDLEVQHWNEVDSSLDLIYEKYGYPRYFNRILYNVFETNDKLIHLFATEWDDPRQLLTNSKEHSIIVKANSDDEFVSKMRTICNEYYVITDYNIEKFGGFTTKIIAVNHLNLYGSALAYFRNEMIDSILKDL